MGIWDLAPLGFDKAKPWGPARWWVLVPFADTKFPTSQMALWGPKNFVNARIFDKPGVYEVFHFALLS